MNDVENIVALIRDIAIIVFGVVGIVAFAVLTILFVKLMKRVNLEIERLSELISSVERVVSVGDEVRSAMLNFVKASKGGDVKGRAQLLGLLAAPATFLLRRLLRSRRDSKRK